METVVYDEVVGVRRDLGLVKQVQSPSDGSSGDIRAYQTIITYIGNANPVELCFRDKMSCII